MRRSGPTAIIPALYRNRGVASPRAVVSLAVLAGMVLAPLPARGELARRDLSDAQRVGIATTSAAVFGVGALMERVTQHKSTCDNYRPPAIDLWFRRVIHGNDGPQSNFLDNNWGSAATPAAALVGMALMDIDRPEFSRDVPLFVSGIVATKGLTDFTKNLVRRPRPCCVGGSCPEVGPDGRSLQSHSFFSGHASSVFFTSTFFNRRFRYHMRQNWTADEYRVGRVVSPIVSFGWATFVGLSRIHADRHYFTDVAAGALVGSLLGELFFRLGYEEKASDRNASGETPLFLIRIPLN